MFWTSAVFWDMVTMYAPSVSAHGEIRQICAFEHLKSGLSTGRCCVTRAARCVSHVSGYTPMDTQDEMIVCGYEYMMLLLNYG
eukprot:5258746-Pleurochrysis_carterae.AAC.2